MWKCFENEPLETTWVFGLNSLSACNLDERVGCIKSEGTFLIPIAGDDIKKVNFHADKMHLLHRGHHV
jgi:hypothetical protein